MTDIDVIELKQKLENKESFLFLDVREKNEYDMYNLNAKLMPMSSFLGFLNELEPYKETEIVIHCRSGMRSANAKQMLVELGFKNVRNLLGGVLAWQEKFEKV